MADAVDKITTLSVPCSIRCGKNVHGPLDKLADEYFAVSIHGEEFYCKSCYARWNWKDFRGAFHPTTITCSNCYSDDVLIVKVLIESWTQE